MARRLVLGSGYIARAFGGGVSRSLVDYTKRDAFERLVRDADVVINCAGFTGRPHIDQCEDMKAETIKANICLPAMLSDVCAERGVRFVHISSGCIFQGSGAFNEGDKPASQLSFYSQTKWLAEQCVQGLILRIRMPFDGSGHDRCLLSKLAKYPRLISEENSITYVPDLVAATDSLLQADAPDGVYHVTNRLAINHKQIASIFGWQKEFIPLWKLDVKAPRSNCTLSSAKVSAYYPMPSVYARLAELAMRKAA